MYILFKHTEYLNQSKAGIIKKTASSRFTALNNNYQIINLIDQIKT